LFKINNKANIFFAIFVIIALVSTLSILIYNNVNILSNNILIWYNNNDINWKIYEKWDIIINSIKEYNWNWNWIIDIIWCPQNITMSWTTMSWSNILSTLTYLNWNIFCSGDYNSYEFRIYFNNDYTNFLQSYYKNDIVNIIDISSDFVWSRNFNDWDFTSISFNSEWVWFDNIDDNFNSDNFRVDSSSWTYYPDWFQDDDILPRKVIVGTIWAWINNENIFWNNYKTNKIIDLNINNIDNYNLKIWNVTDAIIYLEINNKKINNYDLNIFNFDKWEYINYSSIMPLKKYYWDNLNVNYWYIQNNSWALSLSKILTWNEFIFDFKNKDYWIFISNKSDWNIVYRLSSKTINWTWVYITPVDDSKNWIIEVIANNILLDTGYNFIWENLHIINKK
jgi:hypothetical protein